MRRALQPCLGVILALVLAAPFAAAQEPEWERRPIEYTEVPVDQWANDPAAQGEPRYEAVPEDPRYHAQVHQRFEDAIQEGRWLEVIEALAEELRQRPWSGDPGAKSKLQRKLDELADALGAAGALPGIEGPLDTDAERALVIGFLSGRGLGAQVFVPTSEPDDADMEHAALFGGSPEKIAFTTATGAGMYTSAIPPEEMLDLRLRADTVRWLLTKFNEPIRRQHVELIHQAERRWENYLDRGFSQFPWEALFNSLVLDFPPYDPPDHQWILLHPALGVEADVSSFDELRANEALSLEVIGFLKYRGADYEDFYGGSLALTVRDDVGPGVGALLHLKRNLNLGVSWHDFDDDDDYFDDTPSVFFSVDLFRFVSSRAESLQARYESARERLGALRE
ncbi:MAG TPA: hypothetical protein VMS76_05770 [Planctomycetota bacterium]|nr:hypothetical protein [Planctomycetota bacterium]